MLIGIAAYKYYRYKTVNSVSSVENAYVNTKQLNLRSGPGAEYSIITKLSQGDLVTCLERKQVQDGGTWVKVRASSYEGWVNEKLLSSNPSSREGDVPLGSTLKRTENIEIGLVDNSRNQYQDGCGCGFWPVNSEPQFGDPKTQKYILIGNFDKKAWMNINGQIIQLQLDEDTTKYRGKIGDRYYQTYQSGSIAVNVECIATGFGDTHAVFCNATITVIKNDQRQTVKAIGSCGC